MPPHPYRWIRSEPRRELPVDTIQRIVATALPRVTVLETQPLLDGLRNANFKLVLNAPPHVVVLRIYEHEPSLCQKEIDLIRLVCGAGVPVPEILRGIGLHAAALG